MRVGDHELPHGRLIGLYKTKPQLGHDMGGAFPVDDIVHRFLVVLYRRIDGVSLNVSPAVGLIC